MLNKELFAEINNTINTKDVCKYMNEIINYFAKMKTDEEIKSEYKLFVKKIADIMVEEKISVKDLSELMNEDVSVIVSMLYSDAYNINVMLMFKLEKALGIKIFSDSFKKMT